MSTTAHKVATHAAATARGRRRPPPSVLREIVYGMSLGPLAGYLWKLHHWSNHRRTREFYSLLDQGNHRRRRRRAARPVLTTETDDGTPYTASRSLCLSCCLASYVSL